MGGERRRKHLALLYSEAAVGAGVLMLSPSAQMGAIQGKLPIVCSVSGEIRRNFALRFDLRSLLEDLYRQYLFDG